MASKKSIKSALESMMFVWGEPLEAKVAAEIFNVETKEAISYFKELENEYEQEGRGIRIREINSSFQFVTFSENAEYIERLCTPTRQKRLSQSALEVLAIVAYKQPVTRGEIESIRGIKCDRVLEGLQGKELVMEVGRSKGIGRPILYGTTDAFLKYFGYSSIKELPDIEEIDTVFEVENLPGQLDINQISMGDEEIKEGPHKEPDLDI